MSSAPKSIPKKPILPVGQDYFRLRREAIEYVERLGSSSWTDYNTHDPGITILESLIYAINDLSWRCGWDIRHLLRATTRHPFPTARDILTVNPTTTDDYRRLFIDLPSVRNAWVYCDECTCERTQPAVRGLYDARVELKADSLVGDLNDRVIQTILRGESTSGSHDVIVEARFPSWGLAPPQARNYFENGFTRDWKITCTALRSTPGAVESTTQLSDEDFRRNWRNVYYVTLRMSGLADGQKRTIVIPNVSIRLFGSIESKNATTAADLKKHLCRVDIGSVVGLYHRKINLISAALGQVRKAYNSNRNLDEELCHINVIDVDQVAICADVQVAANADIERVQAEIWYALEQYLSPSIPFYSLREMMDGGTSVEEIFTGPKLTSGFIRQQDLESAQLLGVVRGSDIINTLMDIDGVQSIGNLMMTRYDSAGNPVTGVSDPVFKDSGPPEFNTDKVSASWLLYITPMHQPRLYQNLSNFRFTKNGLPFNVDQDEAYDTLTQLRGSAERPKYWAEIEDISVPRFDTRDAADITPVQYHLPLTYGVGPEGLQSSASPLRKSQAHQLKAFLMVFEQLLANAFEQLANFDSLFSISSSDTVTRFTHAFTDRDIKGYDEIQSDLSADTIQSMAERTRDRLSRRNLFLDHVLARFGMDLRDYALALTRLKGQLLADQELIDGKISLLEAYPVISSDRAKAINRADAAVSTHNDTVLRRRVAILLGRADLRFEWSIKKLAAKHTITAFTLKDGAGNDVFQGARSFSDPIRHRAERAAANAILRSLSEPSQYRLVGTSSRSVVTVLDFSGKVIGTMPGHYDSPAKARQAIEEMVSSVALRRAIVVEHLLLRPKFPGAVTCLRCEDCHDNDPWSFRLTVVMPGWAAPYNNNLELRDLANRTIKEEIPSHLLAKICWVGNDGYAVDVCDRVVDQMTEVIEMNVTNDDGTKVSCTDARRCATSLYTLYATRFTKWHQKNRRLIVSPDGASVLVTKWIKTIAFGSSGCTLNLGPVRNLLVELLTSRFVEQMLYGWQFERFESAWYDWLEEDSRFDWGEERLQEHVCAMLMAQSPNGQTESIHAKVRGLLESAGEQLSNWLRSFIDHGKHIDESDVSGFKIELQGASVDIVEYLTMTFRRYAIVTHRLTVLTHLLNRLNNVYPPATLHDCDDGGDVNPVRLNHTALGAAGTRSSAELKLKPAARDDGKLPSAKQPQNRPR